MECKYCGTELRDGYTLQNVGVGPDSPVGEKRTQICPKCAAGFTTVKSYGGTLLCQDWDEPGTFSELIEDNELAEGKEAEAAPALVFPPGEFLKDELTERGIDPASFAASIGRDLPYLEGLFSGELELEPEVAEQLSKELGISREYWLNLEKMYREWLRNQHQAGAL